MGKNILEISRSALRNNLKIIREIAAGAKVCLPVKANAYGHGLELIVEHTHDMVDYFAVACVSEALRVHKTSSDKPILIFGATEYDYINDIFEKELVVSIQSVDDISRLEKYAQKSTKKIKAHININTGMNRMGADFVNYQQTIQQVFDSQYIELLGVYSHFACADNKDHPANKKQIERFKQIEAFTKSLDESIICHLANSYGLLGQKNVTFDMVRPGILTYGHLPYFYVERNVREIKPIARLISEVAKLTRLDENDGVGYSLIYRGVEGEVIATLPVGYGDGFFRALGDRGCVDIAGELYPIVGRISMDALAVSLGQNENNVENNQKVELISDIPKKRNSAFSIAQLINTIEYDITTNLSDRVLRKVV